MSWTTFTLRVETPLFSGDDPNESGGESPIRVPSIRGALRFWFRAVAAGHGITDPKDLWAEEESVFGSTSRPSAIRMRVRDCPSAGGAGTKPEWTGGDGWRGFHGAHYLLGQGLWHFRKGLTRPFVDQDATFLLDVGFSGDERTDHRFLLSIWAWLTWGGLGARARRGFGRLRCVGVSESLPGPFHDHLVADVTQDRWQALAADVIPEQLRSPDITGFPAWLTECEDNAPLPEFPALCPAWWGAVDMVAPQDTFGAAMNIAGRIWRNFRTNSAPAHRPTQDDHSPEWVHALHGDDRRYPIAVLGLPVGYFSSKSQAKAEVNPVVGDEKIRRASPVWFLPVQLPDEDWLVLSHTFWARLLPVGAVLQVKGNIPPAELDVPGPDLAKETWDNWLDYKPRLPGNFYR